MDLVDHVNKLVKVRIEELESKNRSKKDLYYILKQCCKHISNKCLKVNTICLMRVNDRSDF